MFFFEKNKFSINPAEPTRVITAKEFVGSKSTGSLNSPEFCDSDAHAPMHPAT